jgi:hypothetical protein
MGMHPLVLLPIGLTTPIAMACIVLVPSYAGVYYATKIIYGVNHVDLSPYALNVFYILETYITLCSFWVENIQKVDHLSYSLPLIILPLIGIGVSIMGAIIFVGFIMRVFQELE